MEEVEGMTEDRILQVTLELMQDKGFRAVTIRDIAQASGVSEMTVFRHFKTKKGVLEAAVSRYSFMPSFTEIFDKKILHELETDLSLIAATYLNLMKKNRPIFLIAIQERSMMPELANIISKNTTELRELLTEYFVTMQAKNKMITTDANLQTVTFMATLFGYFSSVALWGDLFIQETQEGLVKTMITTFCNGVKMEAAANEEIECRKS